MSNSWDLTFKPSSCSSAIKNICSQDSHQHEISPAQGRAAADEATTNMQMRMQIPGPPRCDS